MCLYYLMKHIYIHVYMCMCMCVCKIMFTNNACAGVNVCKSMCISDIHKSINQLINQYMFVNIYG